MATFRTNERDLVRVPKLNGLSARVATLEDGGGAGGSPASDEPYDATTWNGSLDPPTKNAVRDKVEALVLASGGGGVATVSGALPIVSSGGQTPAISINAATTGAAGSMSAADKAKLDAVTGTNTGNQFTNIPQSRLLGNVGTGFGPAVDVGVADIKALLDLAGSNTGDQDLSAYLPTASFTWDNLTGKPATFSPSAHTHVIADVTGLQGALDGKQPSGTYATGGGTASGTNTGDETKASIDTKIGATGGTTEFYRKDGTFAVPAGGGGGVTTFNTRSGAVTLTSGDVTGALTYTPTSVTGLTGAQSVAAFKTGLALNNVDNTLDSAKVVLSATKLLTARTINGISFDGTTAITVPAVDTATPRLAASAVSAFALTLLDDADAATARATLGAQVAGSYATGTGTANGTNTGDQTSVSGNAGTATKLLTARTISSTGDVTFTTAAFDGSANVSGAATLATVNNDLGTWGNSTQIPVITVDAKGRVTAVTTAAVSGGGGSSDLAVQYSAVGTAKGPAIADYFAASLSLEANSTYEIECHAYFLKTTAGTVIWTWAFGSAPIMTTSRYEATPITGFTTAVVTAAPVQAQATQEASVATAHAASGSLTTAVRHSFMFWVRVRTNAATTIQLRCTESAGTLTPQAGSYLRARKIV